MLLGNHGDISAWIGDALAVPGATDENLRWIAVALYAMNAAAGGTTPTELDDGMQQLQTVAKHLADVAPDGHPLFGVLRPAVAFFAGDAS